MSSPSILLRKKGDVLQHAMCRCDADLVAEELNEWVPTSEENKKYFFDKLYEEEYECDGKKMKGIGLVSSGTTKEKTEFWSDKWPKNTSTWDYCNGEIPLDDERLTEPWKFNHWLEDDNCFDYFERIIIWSDKENKFFEFYPSDYGEAFLFLLEKA